MLAVDLDGTLLDSRGEVSRANASAIARARAAGVRVVVCTGRGLAECRSALRAVEQVDPVVVAGGSIIADPGSSRTIHRYAMERGLVRASVEHMTGDGHAALVLKDPSECGFDYLVVDETGGGRVDPVTRWWFEHHALGVRYARHVDEDGHEECTVRVGACAPASRFDALHHRLGVIAGERAVIHNFPAVVKHDARHDEPVHIIEMFDARATKWDAVSHLAEGWGVSPRRIAAIGDEVNDVSMIKGAGLGVAMGNAVSSVREVASRHTLSNNEDGVAHAVERMLSGEW